MSTRIAAGLWLLIAVHIACAQARTNRPVDQLTSPGSSSSPIVISIVGTNDLHGGILPRDGRGGLALFGGYINNLRAVRAHDGATLLIDAGDMFQGTLESNLGEGATVVAAYNALGYTAATIGNHEFDFGPVGPAVTPAKPGDDPRGALKARAAEAKFAVLAANLIDDATKRAVEWPNVRPSVIVEAAGMRVGIVGVMTLRALAATMSGNVKGLSVAPLAATIAAQATASSRQRRADRRRHRSCRWALHIVRGADRPFIVRRERGNIPGRRRSCPGTGRRHRRRP